MYTPTQRDNPDDDPLIGIDLGTTNSCVGLYRKDSKDVVILANMIGESTTPSWIGLTDQDKIVVGRRARNLKNFVYDAKRMIGKAIDSEDIETMKRGWDFDVVAGEGNSCEVKMPNKDPVNVE